MGNKDIVSVQNHSDSVDIPSMDSFNFDFSDMISEQNKKEEPKLEKQVIEIPVQQISSEIKESSVNDIQKNEVSGNSDFMSFEATETLVIDDNIPNLDSNPPKGKVTKESKLKSSFVTFKSQIQIKIENFKKQHNGKYDVIIYNINDYFNYIILGGLALVSLYFAFFVLQTTKDMSVIEEYYDVKNEILITQKKIVENQSLESLAETLKFGALVEGETRYPKAGYISMLEKVFPKDINEFSLLTFLEGWGSEFITVEGRQIRIDNKILTSFKKTDADIENGMVFELQLQGSPEKIELFLEKIFHNTALKKELLKVEEKYDFDKNEMDNKYTIVFYY